MMYHTGSRLLFGVAAGSTVASLILRLRSARRPQGMAQFFGRSPHHTMEQVGITLGMLAPLAALAGKALRDEAWHTAIQAQTPPAPKGQPPLWEWFRTYLPIATRDTSEHRPREERLSQRR